MEYFNSVQFVPIKLIELIRIRVVNKLADIFFLFLPSNNANVVVV